MVVGTSFAWAHLGKTGGDTTLRLFQLFPELVEYADSSSDPGKHATFIQRPERVAGKARALNIRRLPSWVLAFSIHKALRGTPRYERGPMDSPHQMARTQDPDRYLERFLQGGAIAHWIRVEHLKEDFLSFISRHGNVSDDQRVAVEQLTPANTATYDRDLSHWFSKGQIAQMYENNPLWAKIEQHVYSPPAGEVAKPGCEAGVGT
jgi:hypothetical protein